MKQPARREAVNEYTQGERWSGFGVPPASMVMWPFSLLGVLYGALKRSLGFLALRSTLAPDYRNLQADARPRLVLTLDKAVDSLNVAVSSLSCVEVWVEEARVDLVDVETNGETYTPAQAILKICEPVAPSETLHISLINTVYNAAGRPQGVYSCIISAALRYRTDQSHEEFEQSFPPYRAKMNVLVPINLRRMERFDKPARSREPESLPSRERCEQSKRVRRSQRTASRSAVIVEGKFSDGSSFSDSTHALVLSAYGCIVTLPRPPRIGEGLLLRNIGSLREQLCRVAYVGEKRGGGIQVGLAFETAAPEFWCVDRLPSDCKAALQ